MGTGHDNCARAREGDERVSILHLSVIPEWPKILCNKKERQCQHSSVRPNVILAEGLAVILAEYSAEPKQPKSDESKKYGFWQKQAFLAEIC